MIYHKSRSYSVNNVVNLFQFWGHYEVKGSVLDSVTFGLPVPLKSCNNGINFNVLVRRYKTMWQYGIQPLPDRKSEVEEALNTMSNEGWETISVFYHPNIKEFIPLAESLDRKGLIAVVRKPITS